MKRYSYWKNICAAVITIDGKKRGLNLFQSHSTISISNCRLIIFLFLKKTNWNIESSLCEILNQPQQSEQPICWRVSGGENYSNLFYTPQATYLPLLFLWQPISKLDTHALSLSPWLEGTFLKYCAISSNIVKHCLHVCPGLHIFRWDLSSGPKSPHVLSPNFSYPSPFMSPV